jgi:hypothetical protein
VRRCAQSNQRHECPACTGQPRTRRRKSHDLLHRHPPEPPFQNCAVTARGTIPALPQGRAVSTAQTPPCHRILLTAKPPQGWTGDASSAWRPASPVPANARAPGGAQRPTSGLPPLHRATCIPRPLYTQGHVFFLAHAIPWIAFRHVQLTNKQKIDIQ